MRFVIILLFICTYIQMNIHMYVYVQCISNVKTYECINMHIQMFIHMYIKYVSIKYVAM